MFGRCALCFTLLLAVTISMIGSVSGAEYGFEFSPDSIKRTPGEFLFGYPGLGSLPVNSSLELPVMTVYVESDGSTDMADIRIDGYGGESLGVVGEGAVIFDGSVTGFAAKSVEHPLEGLFGRRLPMVDIARHRSAGRTWWAVSFLPIATGDEGGLVLYDSVRVSIPGSVGPARQSDRFITELIAETADGRFSGCDKVLGAEGSGREYVIITADSLVSSFEELVDFKRATGMETGVVAVESIYAAYSGVDEAEKIRNYLQDFYQGGGIYVLLGGDESIIPARYVYYYNVHSPIEDDYYLMPSDLYYADFTGDWDVDGDGIWGEPTHDAPDIIPELVVGRLPLRSDSLIGNYIDKVIGYATNPGGGDFDYLGRSYFFSSDQMRDYPEGGQHGYIAGRHPVSMAIDTFFAVETPCGDAPSPTNADGQGCIDNICAGYGLVHILAHGRVDGFMVKSANYGDWPASLILTQAQTGSHGSILDLEPNDKYGLYYSLSCDGGGYDLNSIGSGNGHKSLVEGLIATPGAGAVGMVANSRWGWVYSSYLLQASFTGYLFGAAEGNPARAMYYSWLDYPYYRDLIYGQNYFGDPALRIYTAPPQRLEVGFSSEEQGALVTAIGGDGPVGGVFVSIAGQGEILESGFTDQSGSYAIGSNLEGGNEYVVTMAGDGFVTVRETFVPSLVLDLDEDADEFWPESFSLEQNFPNPFNPSTEIGYSLPERAEVTLGIFNILGQRVRVMTIPEQPAGEHIFTWDGTDDRASRVSSGVYLYRLEAGSFVETKKMVLIR